MQDATGDVIAEGSRGTTPWATQRIALAAILLVSVALAAIKLSGPHDLMDNEQQRTAAYVLDTLQNHHWLIQRDQAWEIASKPPLYTWLAAIASWPLAHPTEFAIKLPAALAMVALTLLIFHAARKSFGLDVALLSALAFLLSPSTIKQIGLARGDGIFSLTIAWAALSAYWAWERGRGWTWFWIAAAAAALAKQPGGVIMAAGGLLAVCWEHRQPNRLTIRGNWWLGIPLFLTLTLGWLLLAMHAMGPDVYHKLIIGELIRTGVPGASRAFKLTQLAIPPIYFVTRFLPWSVLAVIQLWRIIIQPAGDDMHRRFERFLFCWIAVSLLCLCIAPHQRGDLLTPLFPPAAILAGRELYRHIARLTIPRARAIVALITICAVFAAGAYVRFIEPGRSEIRQTALVYQFSQTLQKEPGGNFPVTHVDDPFALSFYLGTMRPFYFGLTKWTTGIIDHDLVATYDYEAAAQLLQNDAAVYVAVTQTKELNKYLPNTRIYDLAQTPVHANDLHILSNRPTFAEESRMAMGIGPLRIETDQLKWVTAAQSDFTFAGHGSAAFFNGGREPMPVRVRFEIDGVVMTHTLLPAERWQVTH